MLWCYTYIMDKVETVRLLKKNSVLEKMMHFCLHLQWIIIACHLSVRGRGTEAEEPQRRGPGYHRGCSPLKANLMHRIEWLTSRCCSDTGFWWFCVLQCVWDALHRPPCPELRKYLMFQLHNVSSTSPFRRSDGRWECGVKWERTRYLLVDLYNRAMCQNRSNLPDRHHTAFPFAMDDSYLYDIEEEEFFDCSDESPVLQLAESDLKESAEASFMAGRYQAIKF